PPASPRPDPAISRSSTPASPYPAETATPPAVPIPDDNEGAELPLTMAASVVLTALPRDTRAALQGAGDVGVEKVTIRFQPAHSAPALRQKVFKISAAQRFETVVRFLRKKLGTKESESVFCYVNSVFAPRLDDAVGNLWRCFKVKDELVIAYAMNPAYG
ncbi:ubiquitin-like protein ATG12, partial [Trichodelitschia bisporula]